MESLIYWLTVERFFKIEKPKRADELMQKLPFAWQRVLED